MASDTNLQTLIINKMTKAQYQTITPDETQLYFITDDSGVTSSDIATALGFTPVDYKAGANVSITNGTISATDTTYSAGANISITNGTISATDTTYSAGSGITITNGTISATGTFPSQTGNEGKFLTTDGTVTSWATVDALPSQSGNSGKFLTTNGTVASWETVNAFVIEDFTV